MQQKTKSGFETKSLKYEISKEMKVTFKITANYWSVVFLLCKDEDGPKTNEYRGVGIQ